MVTIESSYANLHAFPRNREMLVKFLLSIGVSLLNVLVHGEFINSGLRNLAKNIETSLYGLV